MTTDEKGKLYLGKLENILTVKLANRTWRLPHLNSDQWTYPPQMDTVVGSKIEVPVAHMWDSAKPD